MKTIVKKLRAIGIKAEIVPSRNMLEQLKEAEGMNMESHVLAEQYRDVYQKTLLYLFENVPVLKRNHDCLYWEERSLEFKYEVLLERAKRGWGSTDEWFLKLAYHLYCNSGTIDLRMMDHLEQEYQAIVVKAISMRYGYKQ